MTGRGLVKIFQKHGWNLVRIKGSHHMMEKEGMPIVPIPVHGNTELGKGITHAILKQGNITFP